MMRISNQPIPEINKIYNQQNKENVVDKSPAAAKSDKVQLSEEACFFGIAMKALQQLPESSATDLQKLESLKTAIKTGTYAVKNEEVVEKIWQESMDKRV